MAESFFYSIFDDVVNHQNERVRFMLNIGFDPNQHQERNQQRFTLLRLAVDHNNLKAVQILVSAGADIHRPQEDGKTLLSIAKERKHNDIAHYLQSLAA